MTERTNDATDDPGARADGAQEDRVQEDRADEASGDTLVIKKYANRRLYDTDSSRYVTLDTLAQMVRGGREFVVQDARTGGDITRSVLTQIIVEEEARGDSLLPIGFLRQLIALYGNGMSGGFPDYLDASMSSFRANSERMREAVEGAIAANPFAELARRNMEFFTGALTKPAVPENRDAEVQSLKRELTALRAQVDRMR